MFTSSPTHGTTAYFLWQPLYGILHIFLDIRQDSFTGNCIKVQFCTSNLFSNPGYISKLVSQQIIPISTMKVSFCQTSVSVFFRGHAVSLRNTGNNRIGILDTIPAKNPITKMQIHISGWGQLSNHIMDFLGFRTTHNSQVRPSIFIYRISFTVSGVESISKPFKIHLFTAEAKHCFQTCFINKSVLRCQK